MKHILTIKPAIPILHLNVVQKALTDLGYNVTEIAESLFDDSECDISFSMKENHEEKA